MSKDFFENYPVIQYDGVASKNILMNVRIIESIVDKIDVFYPYTLKDGERPDTIAHDYYGDSSYYWVVLLSNKIIDPYYSWILDEDQFRTFLKTKYGSIQISQQTILWYENVNYSFIMTIDTFNNVSEEYKQGWTALYAYDYEFRVNEAKRNIKLISNIYLQQIEKEISSIFND